MAFAALMGIGRVLHSAKGHKWNLRNFMILNTVLCLISYLMISLVPNPIINLLGCAICGFAIAVMWPGTLSIAPKLQESVNTNKKHKRLSQSHCGSLKNFIEKGFL